MVKIVEPRILGIWMFILKIYIEIVNFNLFPELQVHATLIVMYLYMIW